MNIQVMEAVDLTRYASPETELEVAQHEALKDLLKSSDELGRDLESSQQNISELERENLNLHSIVYEYDYHINLIKDYIAGTDNDELSSILDRLELALK